jgi:NAD+ kinase
MKVAIVSNEARQSRDTYQVLVEKLKDKKIELNSDNPEIILSIGGDGTLLQAFHQYEDSLDQVKFVGIHTGHLGFYTDWRDFELDELVNLLCKPSATQISYPLLEVKLTGDNCQNDNYFIALNEATVRRVSKTLVANIYLSDEFFESFRGDGLSISTPSGSTAYNKSIGGAVIHPRVAALQLTEIASINNRVFRTLGSPIVIAPDEWIKIKLAPEEDYVLTIDQETIPADRVQMLEFRIAKQRVHFLSFRHLHFWDRVRESFIIQTGDMRNVL